MKLIEPIQQAELDRYLDETFDEQAVRHIRYLLDRLSYAEGIITEIQTALITPIHAYWDEYVLEDIQSIMSNVPP